MFLSMICLCFLRTVKSTDYNFADDNTFYSSGIELSSILENQKHDTKTILKRFRINSLKANPGKFRFMILVKKLLGITIDITLTLNEHINNLCRNASYKFYALLRIRIYLTQDQAKLLYNAFIM